MVDTVVFVTSLHTTDLSGVCVLRMRPPGGRQVSSTRFRLLLPILLIYPICLLALQGCAGLAVAESTAITLVHNGRFPINVCVDGQESFDSFSNEDVAHIVADPRKFQLVTFRDTSFYGRFRQRFNYRIRPGYRASRVFHQHKPESTTSRQRTSPGVVPAGTIG